jgi:hypothetical protein
MEAIKMLYAWKQSSVITQNSFNSMKVNDGQVAEQSKMIAKVSAAVKGSIAYDKSTYEAKKREIVQTSGYVSEGSREETQAPKGISS